MTSEIERLQAAAAKKRASKQAADSFFKSCDVRARVPGAMQRHKRVHARLRRH